MTSALRQHAASASSDALSMNRVDIDYYPIVSFRYLH